MILLNTAHENRIGSLNQSQTRLSPAVRLKHDDFAKSRSLVCVV